MGLSIDEQCINQSIEDIYETERAFAECRTKIERKGPRSLLETGIEVCHVLRDSFKMELKDLRTKGGQADLFKFCQKYQRMLRGLHRSVIGFMPRVSEREYPPEIVRPIESHIYEFERDFALILDPDNSDTFTLTAWPEIHQQYLDQLQPYVPKKYLGHKANSPKWFVFLSFPRAASRNPLLHSITMSHEILHLRDYIQGISAGLSSQVRVSKSEFAKLVSSILGSKIPVPNYERMLMPRTYADFYTRDVLESAVMQQCINVIQQWVREIVADLLAVRTTGPAYLFAFAEHSLALGVMDRDSDKHPNSRMRLKLMLRELRSLGYFVPRKYKQELVQILEMWNRFARESATPDQRPHHTVVTSSIERSLPVIVKEVRSVTKGTVYASGRFRTEVQPLLELLKHGIPPCELLDVDGQTSYFPSLAGILNAGYMAYFCELDSLCDILGTHGEVGKIEARRKLDELLLKAIESTEMWKSWPKEGKTTGRSNSRLTAA